MVAITSMEGMRAVEATMRAAFLAEQREKHAALIAEARGLVDDMSRSNHYQFGDEVGLLRRLADVLEGK